ncbi:MAG: shikimate dehydrogenase, partial [Bacteroidaceae bacterium]|nr:shikimate dehydrogenase [Bacteroidaceae bacterium]
FSYAQITPDVLREYLVVINCSPVGMFPHVDEVPQLPYDALTANHLLYDLVYNPLETKFLQYGAQAGAVVKNGLEMLELQALASWDIWTSK